MANKINWGGIAGSPYAKLHEKYLTAVSKHGDNKAKKAKRLAIVTPNDFFYWIEVDETVLDLRIREFGA